MKNYEAAEMLKDLNSVIHYDPRWLRDNENYSYKHKWMEASYKRLNSAMKERGIDTSNLEAAHERFLDESVKKSESPDKINERFGKELAKAGQTIAEKLNIKTVDMSSYYKSPADDQVREMIDDINYEIDSQPAWSAHEYGAIYMKAHYDNMLNTMKDKNMDTSKLESSYENFISEYQSKDPEKAKAADMNFIDVLSKTVMKLADSMGIKDVNIHETQGKAIEPNEKEICEDEIDF